MTSRTLLMKPRSRASVLPERGGGDSGCVSVCYQAFDDVITIITAAGGQR